MKLSQLISTSFLEPTNIHCYMISTAAHSWLSAGLTTRKLRQKANFKKGLTFPDQQCPKVATQYICCLYSSFLSESRPLMKWQGIQAIWDSRNIKDLLSNTGYSLKRNDKAGTLALHDIQSKAKNTFCSMNRVFSHDTKTAILVSPNDDQRPCRCRWPIPQTSPVGV